MKTLRAQDGARAGASSVLMPGHGSLNLEQHPHMRAGVCVCVGLEEQERERERERAMLPNEAAAGRLAAVRASRNLGSGASSGS